MKLAAIGSNCIDYYSNVDGGKAYPGGGPVNMAVYTVRMGGESSYIGPVGTDKYGDIMREAIEKKGVDVSHLHTVEGNTAVSQVQLIDGERVFGDYDEGVMASYRLSDEDIEFILQHDVVVCDLWGKVEGQLKDLKKLGMTIAYDGATRPEDPECQVAIPYTDYLFFSVDGDDNEELRQQMIKYHELGAKHVIATMGVLGSLCFDGKDFHRAGIVECPDAVDSMGAGDSFISGFLYGIVEGLSIDDAMMKGAANASETLKYFGSF